MEEKVVGEGDIENEEEDIEGDVEEEVNGLNGQHLHNL